MHKCMLLSYLHPTQAVRTACMNYMLAIIDTRQKNTHGFVPSRYSDGSVDRQLVQCFDKSDTRMGVPQSMKIQAA